MLIPWIAPFIAWAGYEATPPPPADVEALTQHLRLRGADAFYSFSPGADDHPDFDARSYRQFALAAWLALDEYFEGPDVVEVLNLETDKTAGVEWSGIRNDDRIVILASNLGVEDPAVIDLPEIAGLPATISVPLNEHVLFTFYTTGCPEESQETGLRLELGQNHPNPFNPRTEIRYDLHATARVTLKVYSIAGRLVRELLDGETQVPGPYRISWDGKDERGRRVTSGVYCYKLEADGEAATSRMVLLK